MGDKLGASLLVRGTLKGATVGTFSGTVVSTYLEAHFSMASPESALISNLHGDHTKSHIREDRTREFQRFEVKTDLNIFISLRASSNFRKTRNISENISEISA